MTRYFRDKLRDQHQLSQEIANAITNNPIGEQPSEDELEAELEGLEQEEMDVRMLKTGTVPVADQIHRLPAAANGESKSLNYILGVCKKYRSNLLTVCSQRKSEAGGRRRRGGGTGEITCGNGYGMNEVDASAYFFCPRSRVNAFGLFRVGWYPLLLSYYCFSALSYSLVPFFAAQPVFVS